MNIIAVTAHPDDETMLCGGTLALLAQKGCNIILLCATRGEGGECGEPPLCTQEELGKVREKELHCAAQKLGCNTLHFLDFFDPPVGMDNQLYPYADSIEQVTHKIIPYFLFYKPLVVISHGTNGEYGHPAHILTYHATIAAVKMYSEPIFFYTFQAAFPHHPKPRLANQDDPADIILDVTSVIHQKIEAALCHKTQHALFVRNASKEAQRQLTVPEVITSMESLRLAFPNKEALESIDPLSKLLK